MAATGPGLGDVLGLALREWRPRGVQESSAIFGAAGGAGERGTADMLSLLAREHGLSADGSMRQFPADPMSRMFSTSTGHRAVKVVGNETLTLAVLEQLGMEAIAVALRLTKAARHADRLIVMPAQEGRPPIVMLMSPEVQDVKESRIISDELNLPFPVIQEVISALLDPEAATLEGAVLSEVLAGGPLALAELFLISQPEVVLTRRPRMIPLCAPWPHLKIAAAGQVSTAGVFCHDEDGDFGVTACYHGTGPEGTPVTVDLWASYVKRASLVQDIVFIPLGEGFNTPPLQGLGGVLSNREPAKADKVRFDGATNQNRTTRIFGTDAGLLRLRPTVQLKLQTDPDTDQGDSGSALIDDQDRILGFAFERTDYNDYPQFTDWMWAANALRALGLTPV